MVGAIAWYDIAVSSTVEGKILIQVKTQIAQEKQYETRKQKKQETEEQK